MKKSRLRFPFKQEESLENGLLASSSRSTASLKNCLQIPIRRRTVSGSRRMIRRRRCCHGLPRYCSAVIINENSKQGRYMAWKFIFWDLDDEPDGNVDHISSITSRSMASPNTMLNTCWPSRIGTISAGPAGCLSSSVTPRKATTFVLSMTKLTTTQFGPLPRFPFNGSLRNGKETTIQATDANSADAKTNRQASRARQRGPSWGHAGLSPEAR